MSLVFDAMVFAREVHKGQRRKYTSNPYVDHLAEVAGIAMSVGWHAAEVHPDALMAICWLHDSMEDQGVAHSTLTDRFGVRVADAVQLLSDLEPGKRAERTAASRDRMAGVPGWIQTIKVADILSNTSSIAQHDPKFAAMYFEEKRLLLNALVNADKRLLGLARAQIEGALPA